MSQSGSLGDLAGREPVQSVEGGERWGYLNSHLRADLRSRLKKALLALSFGLGSWGNILPDSG
jgi:hypothetical protein